MGEGGLSVGRPAIPERRKRELDAFEKWHCRFASGLGLSFRKLTSILRHIRGEMRIQLSLLRKNTHEN
jgi:hypothetical protein